MTASRIAVWLVDNHEQLHDLPPALIVEGTLNRWPGTPDPDLTLAYLIATEILALDAADLDGELVGGSPLWSCAS